VPLQAFGIDLRLAGRPVEARSECDDFWFWLRSWR
jgi:hypothetical protein